ncbi:jg16420 [Pararge aegeria aegeria]|uniref:Jg16420 protein n=1 Tax=Pararge aegeria aegeria TaxID=348720 RepID=A0A8S4SNI2_9NEOP|nr:jg16420 [Pararge aegeria aegeria]
MSLRKILFLTRTACCKVVKLQTTNFSRQNIVLLSASSTRFYSNEHLGDKNKESKEGEKVDILGRFFPQSPPATKDAHEVQKEQEKFEQEQKEKSQENEKNWRRMKIGFAAFGGALTVMGGCLVIEMGAPRRGDDGQPIEDEFSHLPLALQYLRRTWKELTFYEKVIVVDWNKQATQYQPDNALVLNKWKGDDDDTALLDLANLLQTIAMSNVKDVRDVLRYYSQYDDPIAAFRDNQRRLMEQMAERERENKTDVPLARSWLRPFTRR